MQQALDVLLSEYSSGAKTNPSPYETIAALEAELAKPANEFSPDWDQIKPYHDRIAELEVELAKPDVTLIDEGKTWQDLTDDELDLIYKQHHNEYGQGITGQYERAIEAKLREKNG